MSWQPFHQIGATVLLFLLLGCGGDGSGTKSTPVPPAAPTITSFVSNPTTITAGNSATLTGIFSDGTGIITPGNLSATSGVGVTVSPSATTIYTLAVTNAVGTSVSRTTKVTATATPTYGIFRPNKGIATGMILSNSGHQVGSSVRHPASTRAGSSYSLTQLTGTTDLATARCGHAATVLNNGQILISGGTDSAWGAWTYDYASQGGPPGGLSSLEVFDPATEAFYAVNGSLIHPRWLHGTVVLDDGCVLFLGGSVPGGISEIFDPSTGQSYECGTWPAPYLTTGVIAYNLGNGKIFVCACNNAEPVIPFVLTMQKGDSGWAQTDATVFSDDPTYTAMCPATVQLGDGRILFSGGDTWTVWPTAVNTHDLNSSSDISVFDPATLMFTHLGNMLTARAEHAVLDLGNGKVGIYGGHNYADVYNGDERAWQNGGGLTGITLLSSVEVFDLNTGLSVQVGDLAEQKVGMQSGPLQVAGMTLHSGGSDDSQLTTLAQLVFDHETNTSAFTGSMLNPRDLFTMTPLGNGLYMACGGRAFTEAGSIGYSSAEVYDPQASIYLNVPSPSLSYGGSELLTASATVGGTLSWTAAAGKVSPSADGTTCTYTYPDSPQDGSAIASDVVTVTSADGKSRVLVTIWLRN